MSELKLVYSQLDNASKKAKKVNEKCEEYRAELQKDLINKMNAQDFPASPISTDGVSSAFNYVKAKREVLENKKGRYNNLSSKIDTLITNAKSADTAVAENVNKSREEFFKGHKNLKSDGWCAFFATVVVDVPVLSWFVEQIDAFIEGVKGIKNLATQVRYWYEVLGGKKILDTVFAVTGLVLAAIGAVAAVAAIISGITLVAIAGVVLAAIALIDACVNMYYTVKSNSQEDPAWAQYYGKMDKASTALRKTTFGVKWLDKCSGSLALVLDVAEIVCSVITVGDALKKLYNRSGLNALFGNKKAKCDSGKHQYDFDVSKFKQTVTSKQGWSQIGQRLKKNWKILVFGNPSHDNIWKAQQKRYTRAFNKTGAKRVEAIAKLIKTDFSKINTWGKTAKSAMVVFAYGFTGSNTYDALKNSFSGFGIDGEFISSGTKVIDNGSKIKSVVKAFEDYKRVLANMTSIQPAASTAAGGE